MRICLLYTSTILKGAPVVAAMNEANAARCAALREKGVVPTLAVVRVGARPDDLSYEKGVMARCAKVGVEVKQFLLPDVYKRQIMGLLVGSLLALARTYCKKGPARILGWFATAYIELFRNTP